MLISCYGKNIFIVHESLAQCKDPQLGAIQVFICVSWHCIRPIPETEFNTYVCTVTGGDGRICCLGVDVGLPRWSETNCCLNLTGRETI